MTAPTTIDGAMMTDEQIEALWYKCMGHSISSGRMAESAKDFARALLSASKPAAPAQSAEPVAQYQTKLRNPILPSCDVWINVSEEGARTAHEKFAHVYEVRELVERAAPQSSQPVEAGEPCEHCKVNRPYHDLDCPVAAKVLAEKSAVVLDDERAALPRYAEWLHLRTHGEWSDGVPVWARDHTGRMNDFTAATAVIEELARAASPQATVYSLFSSSDRRNFGHLAPQEFVNAVIEAVRAQATATQPAQTVNAMMQAVETGIADEREEVSQAVWKAIEVRVRAALTATQPAQTERALTDERSSFEAAWRQEYPLHGETTFKRSGFNPDAYVNTRVQDGWLMWQARAKTGEKTTAAQPASGQKEGQ
jgi:hypothetical protein